MTGDPATHRWRAGLPWPSRGSGSAAPGPHTGDKREDVRVKTCGNPIFSWLHRLAKEEAPLTGGQQLLSKLVCAFGGTSVRERQRSQLKSNELYDSVVTLLIHGVTSRRLW